MIAVTLAACTAPPTTPADPPATDGPPPPVPDLRDSSDSGTAAPPEPLVFVGVGVSKDNDGCGLVSDGTVRCWGSSAFLGAIPGPEVHLVQLAVDNGNECGVATDGRLGCWCHDTSTYVLCGQEPDGAFERVEVNADLACGQRAGGTLACFVPAEGGQAMIRAQPSEPLLDYDIDSNLGCGIRPDGTPTCWGNTSQFYWLITPPDEPYGEFGALGDGPPSDLAYTDIAVGQRFGCVLATTGEISCWGRDAYGQEMPDPPPGPYTALSAEGTAACAIREGGHVVCWGTTGPSEGYGLPIVQTEAPPHLTFTAIDVNVGNACGVTTEGTLGCWGDGAFEALPEL